MSAENIAAHKAKDDSGDFMMSSEGEERILVEMCESRMSVILEETKMLKGVLEDSSGEPCTSDNTCLVRLTGMVKKNKEDENSFRSCKLCGMVYAKGEVHRPCTETSTPILNP